MIGPDADAAVLALLRRQGPGTFSVKRAAEETGIPRVTVRASVMSLVNAGLVCAVQWAGDWGTGVYEVRHLHAAPGTCEAPLVFLIEEEAP